MKLQLKIAAALLAGILIIPAAQAELSGMLTVSREYNANRCLTKLDYVDASGRVTLAEDKGYSTVCYQYDDANKITKIAYYTPDG